MAKYEPQASVGLAAPDGWVAADLFLHVRQLAGQCPTQAAVISKMRGVTSYNAGGLEPSAIRYAPGVTPDGNPSTCMEFVGINKDSFAATAPPVCT